jgi:hypothetical protein
VGFTLIHRVVSLRNSPAPAAASQLRSASLHTVARYLELRKHQSATKTREAATWHPKIGFQRGRV